MRVVCINDANKPDKIPQHEWIKKGETYTVLAVVKMGLQPGTFGYVLKEVQLSRSSFPYEYYFADRFSDVEESVEKNVEVLEEEFSL